MSEFWKRKMRIYFKTWDYDRDGYISETDVREMAHGFAEAYNSSNERKEYLIQRVVNVWRMYMKAGDFEKDARLTLPIFIETMKQQMYDPELIIEINHLIRGMHGLMDLNQDGYLQPDEFRTYFEKCGVPEGTFDEKFAFGERVMYL